MGETEQLGLSFHAPARKVYVVSELVSALRTHLERAFTDVYVEGEISNCRPAESGHLYFTLKDGSCQLRAVMWRTQARLLRFRPANGMQVIARGRVTLYEERGDLQFQAEYLEPKGAGALQIAFEQLKSKLAAEGLFDPARKKATPKLPRRIGVVTSPRGAAIQDILNVLRRRHESVNVLLYPAQVQGESAAAEVSAGIRYLDRHGSVDVIVIARGGGSFEDLFAFNDEGLARTIALSHTPIISAVGHETDFTICDFVADLRAPTPSAAAELVVASKQDVVEMLRGLRKRMKQTMRYMLLQNQNALARVANHPSFTRMRDSLARRQQHVDDLVFRAAQAESRLLKIFFRSLEQYEARLRRQDLRVRLRGIRSHLEQPTAELRSAARNFLAFRKNRLTHLTQTLERQGPVLLFRRRARWERLHSSLQTLSPAAILERGYALVFDANGRLVRQASALVQGEEVRTRLGRGEFTALVEDIKDEGGAE